jgi:hypothetical protein
VPATHNPTIFDKAKQVAAGAQVPPNPTIFDKAKQVAAAAHGIGGPAQVPTGTGGKLGDPGIGGSGSHLDRGQIGRSHYADTNARAAATRAEAER